MQAARVRKTFRPLWGHIASPAHQTKRSRTDQQNIGVTAIFPHGVPGARETIRRARDAANSSRRGSCASGQASGARRRPDARVRIEQGLIKRPPFADHAVGERYRTLTPGPGRRHANKLSLITYFLDNEGLLLEAPQSFDHPAVWEHTRATFRKQSRTSQRADDNSGTSPLAYD